MKSTLRTLIAAAFVLGLASTASAQRGGTPFANKTYKQAATQEGRQGLKKADQYMVVCMACKSVTVKEVADEKEVAALCHDGGTIHCDSCKKKVTIKRVGPPGKESVAGSKVTYVNEKGEECMFIVPVKD
jgi:hypothetical protein